MQKRQHLPSLPVPAPFSVQSPCPNRPPSTLPTTSMDYGGVAQSSSSAAPPAENPHPAVAVPLQGRSQKSYSPGPIWALTFIRTNTEYPLESVSHWLAGPLRPTSIPHKSQGQIEPYGEQFGPEYYYVDVDAQMNNTIYRAALRLIHGTRVDAFSPS